MNLQVVGLSHRTAPLEVRERLHFDEDRLPLALSRLPRDAGVEEGMILSTCNRVEIYAHTRGEDGNLSRLGRFLGEFHGVHPDLYLPYLYLHSRTEAARHLFRVASSLDSLVVGEPQILGQVKSAFEKAREAGSAGSGLQPVLDRAFRAAKRVRTETGIAESAVSVSSAAVDLGRRIFGSLSGRSVLLVGASEMGRLAAKHLLEQGAVEMVVANRSFRKASEMAARCEGSAIPFRRIPEQLIHADMVLTCTGSPEPILRREQVSRAMQRRRHRPLFLVDIAVPRDIDPAVHRLDNVYLYNIDDLQQVVEENRRQRRREADRAEAIVDREVQDFRGWLRQREVVPTLKALRETLHDLGQAELDRVSHRLADLEPGEREAVEEATRRLLNKILHRPLREVRDAAREEQGLERIRQVRRLFGLEDD